MKFIVFLLLLSVASRAGAVSQKEIDKRDALAKVYPFEKKDKQMKREFPSLWIMDSHERGKLRDRRPEQPRYYQDPKHGSNKGYDYA